MILFCIETCGSTFFLQQQLGVFQCAVVWPPTQGGWSDESATAYLGVGDVLGGGGREREKRSTAASNLPAEPVAAFSWTETYAVQDKGGRGERGRVGGGKRSTPNTETDFTWKPDEGQIH